MKIKHNKAHTWITNGYCHGCQKKLTAKEIEIEFPPVKKNKKRILIYRGD